MHVGHTRIITRIYVYIKVCRFVYIYEFIYVFYVSNLAQIILYTAASTAVMMMIIIITSLLLLSRRADGFVSSKRAEKTNNDGTVR